MSYMRDAALLKYYRSCAVLRKRTSSRVVSNRKIGYS